MTYEYIFQMDKVLFNENGEIVTRPKVVGKLVRCKDCKHRDPEDKKCDCGMWHLPYVTRDKDYCSYGERKEE